MSGPIDVKSASELCFKLGEILSEATQGKVSPTQDQWDLGFKDLGMDSVGFLSYLVAIEDELGMEWSPDTPREVLKSIRSISDYLVESELA